MGLARPGAPRPRRQRRCRRHPDAQARERGLGARLRGRRADVDADVDPIAFVWREVESRAQRVLREVDALARAYGWTEAEVLALSEQRRAAYLEIVREGP